VREAATLIQDRPLINVSFCYNKLPKSKVNKVYPLILGLQAAISKIIKKRIGLVEDSETNNILQKEKNSNGAC
jgi:hypothetical protein